MISSPTLSTNTQSSSLLPRNDITTPSDLFGGRFVCNGSKLYIITIYVIYYISNTKEVRS